jgi:hypothetical protein
MLRYNLAAKAGLTLSVRPINVNDMILENTIPPSLIWFAAAHKSATTSRAGGMRKAPGRGQALLVVADLYCFYPFLIRIYLAQRLTGRVFNHTFLAGLFEFRLELNTGPFKS